jgi:hypothetical protein
MSEVRPVDGAVVRPLVDPVPLYAWAMLHRRDAHHGALATLHAIVSDLAQTEGWTVIPPGAWLPRADTAWSS